MSDLNLLLITALGIVALVAYLRFQRPRSPTAPTKPPRKPAQYIVVDGSNVMHWGGEPSELVLTRVIARLKKSGLTPIVYFDANVGYKLGNRHANSQDMATRLMLAHHHVIVVPKGVVADEILLQTARHRQRLARRHQRQVLGLAHAVPGCREKGVLGQRRMAARQCYVARVVRGVVRASTHPTVCYCG